MICSSTTIDPNSTILQLHRLGEGRVYLYVCVFSSTHELACPSSRQLVLITIILLIRQQRSVPSTSQILLQPAIAPRVRITYPNRQQDRTLTSRIVAEKGEENIPCPPTKLNATGKKTKACNAAQITNANHTRK